MSSCAPSLALLLVLFVSFSVSPPRSFTNIFSKFKQNGDYPFKIGTYMGSDAFGNRYYENRVDYPFGQHRWVEPADIHNYDAAHIPPEWHGWMTHVNDATPSLEEEYIQSKLADTATGEISHNPFTTNVGRQEPFFNFHGMHNQSTIRSRGYGIGNQVVGLPPGAPDAYYTQPGSPYNPAQREPKEKIAQGDLGPDRPYKNQMWRQRLLTPAERDAEAAAAVAEFAPESSSAAVLTARERAIRARGGTTVE